MRASTQAKQHLVSLPRYRGQFRNSKPESDDFQALPVRSVAHSGRFSENGSTEDGSLNGSDWADPKSAMFWKYIVVCVVLVRLLREWLVFLWFQPHSHACVSVFAVGDVFRPLLWPDRWTDEYFAVGNISDEKRRHRRPERQGLCAKARIAPTG